MLTFVGPNKQKSLEVFLYLGAKPRDHWASGRGAIIAGKDFNRRAAIVGAARLNGRVQHG